MEMENSYVGMSNCFFCNQPKEILLDRRLKVSLPMNAVYDKEPCDKCKEYMTMGILIISVRDGESGDNPYRTGGWWVVKEDFIKRIMKEGELRDNILKMRVLFLEDSVADKLGLIKGSQEE
jgi:hypothetical protein